MMFWVKVESEEKRVRIEETGGLYSVEIDGRKRLVDCRTAGHRDQLSLIIDNRSYLIESAPVKVDEGTYYAKIAGRRYNLEIFDERLIAARQARARTREDGPCIIRSPMPGLIVEVRVGPGDRVTAGSTVVVMEAMKMQNELLCEVDGVVRAVNVKAHDTVESQAILLEIERTE
jgi:biotin carboxyl carrier protein